MPKIIKGAIFWFPVVLWMTVIYFLSSFHKLQTSEVAWEDFIIRKTAHFLEYFFLYVLIFRAMTNTTKIKGWRIFLTCLVVTILYSVSDEYHQTFISGRSGKIADVGFDSSGGLFGLYFSWKLINLLPKKIKESIF